MEVYLWMIIVMLGIFSVFSIRIIIKINSNLEDANLEISKRDITIRRMRNKDY